MKCARCNRPLRAATIQISGCAYGPKCADRMGLSTTKPKKTRIFVQISGQWMRREYDPNQFALEFEQ